jgi:hypothetical protein
MKTVRSVLDRIESHKHCLAHGDLFRWLGDEAIDGRRRLAFAPAMLYYLMGFKDVLAALQRAAPGGGFDEAIRAYCGEDAEHWRWYLTDLELLDHGLGTWGATIPAWCDEVWGASTEANRRTIFRLVQHASQQGHPMRALALIWVFEATGTLFIGHTRKAAIALNMDDALRYFGRLHYEEEFAHSVVASSFAQVPLDDRTYDDICAMVDQVFEDYDSLFQCWYQQRDRFCAPSKKVPPPTTALAALT